MLEITVLTRQGVSMQTHMVGRFGAQGGTIGRAEQNLLVLDDPDRTVSRVHAQIACRDGTYVIVDRGSNPLQLNGQPVGAGNEAALSLGDRLFIGGFELEVSALQAPGIPMAATASVAPMTAAAVTPSDDDPFADLLAGLSPTAPAPPAAARTPPAHEPAPPFTDPLGDSACPAQASAADPFADLLGPPASPPPGEGQDALTPGTAHATSIDDLFGGIGVGDGSDPFALSPLADPLLQPNTAANTDPLAALGQGAAATPAPRGDQVAVGQFGYVPPLAIHAQPPPAPAPAPVSAPLPERVQVRVGAAASAKPPAAPTPARAASDDELLAALLKGLGGLHQAPNLLTLGLMERIGVLLRTATEGTLQLLLARQELKREVRAQVTMIAAQANNPLKFSPTADVALSHLLGPGVRGFMPAEAAMRDAYHDLRAHEFAMMVGMRAALAHIIDQFSPQALEQNIAAKSALDSVFAANRKAKLWDQFAKLYGDIAREAEDDFHSLFGKAFVQAYEEQMARLAAER